MKIYDVIIIGAGVVGAAISRELSRYRLNVAILEREEELAFGVSKSNSGIIHPGTQNPPHLLKSRLCVEGNRLIRRIAGELGVDFKEVGELIVAFTDQEAGRLGELKRDAEILGVPGLKIVDRQWLRANEPNLSDKAAAALYAPTAGILSPYRLVYDMSENAVKNGVDIYTGAKAQYIKRTPYFEIGTPKGVFRSRYLVNAAGLFADDVSKMAGVDNFKIRPRRGEEFILDKKQEYLTNHLIFPIPSKNSKGVLIIKTADGNPVIGPSAEDIDDKEDLSTSGEGFRKVMSSAQRMIPSIDENAIIAYFAGLRPVGITAPPSAAGEDFIIRHEDSIPGLINVAGIQSPGLTASPAIAVMVRALLEGHGLPLKRKLIFHGHRKKTIHLFDIPLDKTRKLIRKDAAYGDIICRCEMISAKEVRDAIKRGARTLDGVKFRTRAQAGRCHGTFCTTRIIKILSQELKIPLTTVTKRGKGSEVVKNDRAYD